MNRKALGKGINALIPDFEIGVPEPGVSGKQGVTQTRELLIDEISPNRFQPRKYFDDDKLEELVTSIRENGILQPVVVQKSETGYELVAGERRWRASKKAGLKKIPAMIREVSDTKALELAIIENIHRQDLNPIEEAEAYKRLAEEFSLTQEMIAEKVGKSRAAIANILRLLNLSRNIQENLISGKLSMGHARALLGLDNTGQMQAMCQEILKQGLTVRQTESKVNRLKKPEILKLASSMKKKNIFIRDLEKELERKLGTKVEVSPKKTGGKLVVSYYSDDDLERIQNLIG
ncbi:MAG: ParB/RepB/Spo0J family partition protein [Nitrospina sp.]|nr:ParB/RepB/Spo0J family partition protein [Nitrospina sp.]